MFNRALLLLMHVTSALLLLPLSACAVSSTEVSQDAKVDAIVSIFENSTPELQYAYVEALGDGRGYTAGRAGFTTATGDLYLVVRRFLSLDSSREWSALLPRLKKLSETESGSIAGLESLPRLWAASSALSTFRRAQDDVTTDLYKQPAREICERRGLKSDLAYLVIYDSIIQHGNGDDDDSLSSMMARTHSSGDEKDFIRAFLEVRRATLMNPSNDETADEWRASVDRVEALKRLVDEGNWSLSSPLNLKVWGETYPL